MAAYGRQPGIKNIQTHKEANEQTFVHLAGSRHGSGRVGAGDVLDGAGLSGDHLCTALVPIDAVVVWPGFETKTQNK